MPLLDCPVDFCTGERDPDRTPFAPCDRGGPCPRCVDLDSLKRSEVRKRTRAAVEAHDTLKLADLLREAASAHHAYEEHIGAPDADWPDWYAEYLLGPNGTT